MEHNETNTLESIIRAAREMARQRTKERDLKPDLEDDLESNPKTSLEDNPDAESETELEDSLEAGSEADLETSKIDVSLSSAENTALCEHTNHAESSESFEPQYAHEDSAKSKSAYIDPDPDEEALDFSDSTALLSAAQTFSDTLQTTGVHFLEFSVAFISMTRRHYQQDISGELRANSLAFHALLALDSWADEHYTMSDLAEKLQIPKQQLTKLINDLESKELVTRIHDTENRRRVYIRICEKGRTLMEELKQEMLQSTLHGLRSYTKDDLLELDQCICRLTELMEKFNTDPA